MPNSTNYTQSSDNSTNYGSANLAGTAIKLNDTLTPLNSILITLTGFVPNYYPSSISNTPYNAVAEVNTNYSSNLVNSTDYLTILQGILANSLVVTANSTTILATGYTTTQLTSHSTDWSKT